MTRFVLVVTSLLALSLCQAFAGQPKKDNPSPRGFLGVAVGPVAEQDDGVVVQEVTLNSPAAKAGLKNGDEVLKLNGQPVKNVQDFIQGVAARKPGEKVTLQVRRDGKEQTLDATLGERPAQKRLIPGLPGGGPPALLLDQQSHIQALERRIEMLEKRLNELEKKLPPGK